MDSEVISTLIIGGAGLIITIIIAIQNQSLANQQMTKQLFTEFNERYGKLNDCLVEIQTNCPTLESFWTHSKSNSYKKSLLDYFNLCAEEHYWYKKGRIDEKIWLSWQAGMNYWYENIPIIKSLWATEKANEGYKSYYLEDTQDFFIENQKR
jgi:hypothetical protein